MKSKYILLCNTTKMLKKRVSIRKWTLSYVLIFLASFLFVISISQASELNGSIFDKRGIVWQGNAISSSLGPITSGVQAQYVIGTNVKASNLSWGSVDGYYGIILAPGIVAVLSGYSNVRSGDNFISNVNFNFNSNPIPSPKNTAQEIIYNNPPVVYRINSTSGTNVWARQADVNILGAIYISSSAKSGRYSYPKITFEPMSGRGTYNDMILYPFGEEGGTFYIPSGLECTISAPPTINFGQVTAKGDGWVPIANQDSLLQVNCSGGVSPESSATANISFTASPLYYNRSEQLELTTDGSYGVGILNGRYGKGKISNCYANDSNDADAVKFNGSVSKTLELNVGINEVPITWTVCRRGDVQQYGNTSAQATVNVNWD